MFFDFYGPPGPKSKVWPCNYAQYMNLEENRLSNNHSYPFLWLKTWEIGCFSTAPRPKSKSRLRQGTRLCTTRILRGHWRKSVEKQKSLCKKTEGGGAIIIIIIKCILSYDKPGKASYLETFFYQLGGCLSVGGVVW